MTPARLQSFLAIVDTGSARSAAAQLHVTESAVSASLAALQHEVGAALFERQGRGLRLTESGAVFASYARQIGLIDESVVATRSGVAPESGKLRLGAFTTAGEYLVPGSAGDFRAAFPHVEITLEVGVRDHILQRLADHHLDVVVGGRPLPGRGMVSRATRDNSLIVVSAPGYESDLAEATWLLREPGSGTRATMLALQESLGIVPPTLSLGSHGAVIASAVLGAGRHPGVGGRGRLVPGGGRAGATARRRHADVTALAPAHRPPPHRHHRAVRGPSDHRGLRRTSLRPAPPSSPGRVRCQSRSGGADPMQSTWLLAQPTPGQVRAGDALADPEFHHAMAARLSPGSPGRSAGRSAGRSSPTGRSSWASASPGAAGRGAGPSRAPGLTAAST